MAFQNATLDIMDIPDHLFPAFSDYLRKYFNALPSESETQCEKLNYASSYISRWSQFTRYNSDTRHIGNDCTVYAHPLIFAPALRTLIQELTKAFPQSSFHGSYRLFSSNWGYDAYPFRSEGGSLTWEEETLGSQHPETHRFWNAMEESGYTDIPDLLAAMYAPMTSHQLYHAFALLDDLFFDPMQEVTPVDAYEFDNEGIPERESMVDFTYNCFLYHCWEDYPDIRAFFRAIREQYSKKDIPFEFPENFLAALNRRK